jgi:[glutamine synthetase] adenylyltransferase / [glutamine synthetase]-adenylyl-L-tyrosine phosphorylase
VNLNELPALLTERASASWQQIIERASTGEALQLEQLAAGPELARQLPVVLAASPFVADLAKRRPAMFIELLASGDLQRTLPEPTFEQQLSLSLNAKPDELDTVLRQFRQRHMLRIIWRDFCRLADTLETVRDTSLLAQASIRVALHYHHAALEQRYGRPLGRRSGQPQQMIVMAMGKLGAGELNVSSDIDLIFVYPEAGDTDGEKPVSNEQFFIKLGQKVIASLDKITADGFVFRVDMRLRPYGESGALVHNFAALEEYYQDQGRDWERYALIKARPVTGEPESAAVLMDALRPFVFRRYIDFGVIDSLRSMKQMISAEVRRRRLHNDVKLGHGGIREVEFIAQCFQLIRGGRDTSLQQRELLLILDECTRLGCLPAQASAELRSAYLFLRDSEHAIQGYQDKQSQALPDSEPQQSAMAMIMGFDSWQDYLDCLDSHRARVSAHFSELIAPPEGEGVDAVAELPPWDDTLAEETLAQIGFEQPAVALEQLMALRCNGKVMALQTEGRERLELFMPQLLQACREVDNPDQALARLLPLVIAVVRRSAYLALLLENPQALEELVMLCAASPWIADQMARSPVLLDELLDRSSLYLVADRDLLQSQLQQQMARLAEDDLEAQMDALRYFKAAQVLRVAASEITGRLPLMKVSDNLSWIAEVILEQVLAMAWSDLTRKYGEPQRDSTGYSFAVFGYGKLGGIELGHGSDLDLVFIQDARPQGQTSGPRTIDNAVFYTRLGQRIIHILETRMAIGQLYEVDMRLRPSGSSGMLVASVEGFARYQQDSAWTWEHQALVRARMVAGDVTVGDKVEAIRRDILCQSRDQAKLAQEVVSMRRKMSDHLLKGIDAEREFHIKQGAGGIVDIEFMVQYAVLAYSHEQPELTRWSDNIRILETLEATGLFSAQDSQDLRNAYLAFRCTVHQLSLQQSPMVVSADQFIKERLVVQEKWRQLFGDSDEDVGGDQAL